MFYFPVEKQRTHHRDIGKWQDKRTNQCKCNRLRHGLNILPSMPPVAWKSGDKQPGWWSAQTRRCSSFCLPRSSLHDPFPVCWVVICAKCLLWLNLCITASTIITAPSTIRPKSNAPRLIRFPLTPNRFIMITANNMASGITEATTSPARRFQETIQVQTRRSMRLPRGFWLPYQWHLFYHFLSGLKRFNHHTFRQGFCIWSIRSFTSFTTSLLFAPFSIITTAPATSPLSL